MLDLLFVYGTLHPDSAPQEIRSVVSQFVPIGQATLHARLYRFAHYPAIVLDPAAPALEGALFRLPDLSLLALLDAYEGYLPEALHASLFLRRQTTVQLLTGESLQAWVYEYAQLLPR